MWWKGVRNWAEEGRNKYARKQIDSNEKSDRFLARPCIFPSFCGAGHDSITVSHLEFLRHVDKRIEVYYTPQPRINSRFSARPI
jgi:hypothetical protein